MAELWMNAEERRKRFARRRAALNPQHQAGVAAGPPRATQSCRLLFVIFLEDCVYRCFGLRLCERGNAIFSTATANVERRYDAESRKGFESREEDEERRERTTFARSEILDIHPMSTSQQWRVWVSPQPGPKDLKALIDLSKIVYRGNKGGRLEKSERQKRNVNNDPRRPQSPLLNEPDVDVSAARSVASRAPQRKSLASKRLLLVSARYGLHESFPIPLFPENEKGGEFLSSSRSQRRRPVISELEEKQCHVGLPPPSSSSYDSDRFDISSSPCGLDSSQPQPRRAMEMMYDEMRMIARMIVKRGMGGRMGTWELES
ncbi:hypothetical protein SCHPADRAFT_886174 [Schizopora paradoxa]|uniref:Uncharacterized protein n=1 Tax=Schizopora paradoxa TaxID=27342 RepID=A0A0H2S398_9AGAM|nr:hypothetical protein SCHPADRAFT_886174 [Schizopora paradoxa]